MADIGNHVASYFQRFIGKISEALTPQTIIGHYEERLETLVSMGLADSVDKVIGQATEIYHQIRDVYSEAKKQHNNIGVTVKLGSKERDITEYFLSGGLTEEQKRVASRSLGLSFSGNGLFDAYKDDLGMLSRGEALLKCIELYISLAEIYEPGDQVIFLVGKDSVEIRRLFNSPDLGDSSRLVRPMPENIN